MSVTHDLPLKEVRTRHASVVRPTQRRFAWSCTLRIEHSVYIYFKYLLMKSLHSFEDCQLRELENFPLVTSFLSFAVNWMHILITLKDSLATMKFQAKTTGNDYIHYKDAPFQANNANWNWEGFSLTDHEFCLIILLTLSASWAALVKIWTLKNSTVSIIDYHALQQMIGVIRPLDVN